jgi:hypothetical protein
MSACARLDRSLFLMRRLLIGLLLALAVPASALARQPVRTVAPPGNSGVSQYLETIPTAKGNRPSVSVVPGGGQGPGSSGGSSALSSSTQRALDQHGSAGRQAAALADATAPSVAPRTSNSHGAKRAAVPSGASAATVAPPAAVLKAVTGSSAHGGLGALLPVLLTVIALGGGALALRRRRGARPDGSD